MSSSDRSSEAMFSIVSRAESKQNPYPYVFVEDDGSVRELRPDEKTFLETPFLPMDGGRPAIKVSYASKNGWGSLRGFCRRISIPEGIVILPYKSAETSAQDLIDPDSEDRFE